MHAQEIKNRLARYVAGNQSLEEFEDWFLPATWNLTADNGEAGKLASEIWLRLAEFDSGAWQETDLKDVFAEILARETSRKVTSRTRPHKRATRT